MRNDRIVPGVILILLGGLFILHNFGWLHVHWENFGYLWPVFIIIGGVNLLLAHNRAPWATALRIGVVVAGFALIAFGNFGNRYHLWPGRNITFGHWNNDDNSDDDDDTTSSREIVKVEGNSSFNQPYTNDARAVQLNVSGGATTYTLNDTTNQLFSANTKEFMGRYEFAHRKEGDSLYVLDFKMKENHGFNMRKNQKSNEAILKLNPNPVWDVNVGAGAAETNFDLSRFKVRKVRLKGGAATFNLKMGEPLASTKINVETGMADVTIRIPKNAACRITKDTGLSSSNFEGFTKQGDDSYETPGYAAAKNKMQISIDAGLSSFKVTRY